MTLAEILRSLPPRKHHDAIWLLSSLLGKSKSEILLEAHRELSSAESKKWKSWWHKREKGVPLQYVAGFAPFYGREFAVDKNVLIPRPETERLVEIVLGIVRKGSRARVLDIGTGSGAIALTPKAENPGLEVCGTDISACALRIARKNARLLALNARFEKHDLFSPRLRGERWDLIVSNPPYLDFRQDRIALDVKKWEPRLALEPTANQKVRTLPERAAWCAERILAACARANPGHTALELSPRIALYLEQRWRKNASVARIWREADLAGRKRFLLVAWKDG